MRVCVAPPTTYASFRAFLLFLCVLRALCGRSAASPFTYSFGSLRILSQSL